VKLDFSLRILIVPHAGYIYSGPVAATGYQLLAGIRDLRRIVMLGPSHYEPFAGLALPGADLLETPLGTVAVEAKGASAIAAAPLVIDSAPVHAREHSLEVQLPFVQILAPGIPVIPLLTGSIGPDAGADIVAPLLDETTLLLVSSDLSHYHDAATARRLDAETAQAIAQLDPDALGRKSACGRTGVQIALHLARRYGYQAQVLDLRNSADTAGPSDRVVGYGTFAFGV
jgi:AmmeMemoRadiSam system protein B